MNIFDSHYPECENQPDGKLCICPDIEEGLNETQTEISLEDALTNKAFIYNQEVGAVIAEALA